MQVNAEGRAIAGAVRGGTWLQNRRVTVQKRGDPLGADGGLIHYAEDAHAGERGWVKGRCVLLQCACWVCGVWCLRETCTGWLFLFVVQM